jgi:hypothetical protein
MCKITDKAIQADGAAVASAVNSIVLALAATNPTLATELTKAADTLVAATSGFTTGSVTTDINTAATAIEAILAAIPVTVPYAAFVAIAVTALDILIANIQTQPTQTNDTVDNAVVLKAHIATLPANPFRGQVSIHRHFAEGPRSALVRTWNDEVDVNPQPGFSKLT